MTICLVDTSIFCNVIEVPGRCQHTAEIIDGLKQRIEDEFSLLLPLAAIVETGNHIAHVTDGRRRRDAAGRFVRQVSLAFRGEAPWVVTPIPDAMDWLDWLEGFPDHAMRGIGMGDLTIIREYERQCRLNPARRVLIWSLDGDLSGYDREP